MPAGNAGVAHALFVSKDHRIPKIRIQTRQLGNLLDKRIIVAVDSWDCLSRYPSGHYVRTIGQIGDRDTESEVSCNSCLFAYIFLFLVGLGDVSFTSRCYLILLIFFFVTYELSRVS